MGQSRLRSAHRLLNVGALVASISLAGTFLTACGAPGGSDASTNLPAESVRTVVTFGTDTSTASIALPRSSLTVPVTTPGFPCALSAATRAS